MSTSSAQPKSSSSSEPTILGHDKKDVYICDIGQPKPRGKIIDNIRSKHYDCLYSLPKVFLLKRLLLESTELRAVLDLINRSGASTLIINDIIEYMRLWCSSVTSKRLEGTGLKPNTWYQHELNDKVKLLAESLAGLWHIEEIEILALEGDPELGLPAQTDDCMIINPVSNELVRMNNHRYHLKFSDYFRLAELLIACAGEKLTTISLTGLDPDTDSSPRLSDRAQAMRLIELSKKAAAKGITLNLPTKLLPLIEELLQQQKASSSAPSFSLRRLGSSVTSFVASLTTPLEQQVGNGVSPQSPSKLGKRQTTDAPSDQERSNKRRPN